VEPINREYHRVQTGFGAHLSSYSVGARGSVPGGKVVGAWSYTSTPPPSMSYGMVIS